MYEISLVPEVKAQLLRKQKMRNLIILVCIGVAVACAVILALLGSVIGTQALTMNGQETEIACRAEGKLKKGDSRACKKFKETPVAKFQNLNTLLAIQDQLSSLDVLNDSKIKYSRVFGLMDVLFLKDHNGQTIEVNEMSANFSDMQLSFDAIGRDESTDKPIGYKPLETFKKHALRTYYDYGEYMRKDENGEYVPIPYYCVSEYSDANTGEIFGVYRKGDFGCEASMIIGAQKEEGDKPEGDKPEEEKEKSEEELEAERQEAAAAEVAQEQDRLSKIEPIIIRRTYRKSKDLDDIKAGAQEAYEGINVDALKANLAANPSFAGVNLDKMKYAPGYFFDSKCLSFGADETLDEDASLLSCSVLKDGEEGILITNDAYGRTSDGEMVLSFHANISVSYDIFKASNHNVRIIGPSRQNVTDSYVEVRDMFTSDNKDNIELEEGK